MFKASLVSNFFKQTDLKTNLYGAQRPNNYFPNKIHFTGYSWEVDMGKEEKWRMIFFLGVISIIDKESDLRNSIIFYKYDKNYPKHENGNLTILTSAKNLHAGRFRLSDSKS